MQNKIKVQVKGELEGKEKGRVGKNVGEGMQKACVCVGKKAKACVMQQLQAEEPRGKVFWG